MDLLIKQILGTLGNSNHKKYPVVTEVKEYVMQMRLMFLFYQKIWKEKKDHLAEIILIKKDIFS